MFMQVVMYSLTCWQGERGCWVNLHSLRSIITVGILDAKVATVVAMLA